MSFHLANPMTELDISLGVMENFLYWMLRALCMALLKAK